jgi:transcriptional regulator with XRE-family HTH domain
LEDKKYRELYAKALGKHLRLGRYAKNLSTGELADITDMDSVHIGRIERGETLPELPTLDKLNKGLNLSLDRLVKDIEEEIRLLQDDDEK